MDGWMDAVGVQDSPSLDSLNGPLRGGDKDGMGSEQRPRATEVPTCR